MCSVTGTGHAEELRKGQQGWRTAEAELERLYIDGHDGAVVLEGLRSRVGVIESRDKGDDLGGGKRENATVDTADENMNIAED